jgi:hypothetical protein
MISTNSVRKKTAMNGPTKAFIMSLSSFLNINQNSAVGRMPVTTFVRRTPLEKNNAEIKNTAFTF